MSYKNCTLLIFLVIVTTGCDVELDNQNTFTATPGFVTATLPAAPILLPTKTPLPPTPIPTISPVEGTTITQVNVRAETSSASENLGMIAQFSTVQVIGKDASGSWYQIIYTDSRIGWVRAEYVQVNASAQIPVIKSGTGNESGLSGLVIQKINVRNGPGTTYDALGVLNPNDVVFMTGKSSSGAWIQIEYTNAPDGKGWAASEFLKIEDADSLPVIGETGASQQAPTDIVGTPAVIILPAMQDGDSMGAPLAKVRIGPGSTRAFQVNGDVSAPEGDAEDWVEFNSYSEVVVIQVSCSGSALNVELWNNGARVDDLLLTCGEERVLSIFPNNAYVLRLFNPASNEFRYTKYILNIEAVH
ncbi:MAG: SH3 domain-containing protein [Anaerolineales bacterium]|nr:SH3 domain-containing protein [Anaerolineales bacterium]